MGAEYRKVAKELGVKYLVGRWGFSVNSKAWGIRFVPLDGWITDPKEIVKEITKQGGL